MCMIKCLKNKVLGSCAIIFFIAAMLVLTVGNQHVSAQWLYYPANAISLYGQPSIFITSPVPTTTGVLPFNYLYLPGSTPAIPVLPPAPATTVASPITLSTITTGISLPSSIYNPLSIINPLITLPLLSPVTSAATVTPPTNTYFLYYAPGSAPGVPIAPPAATGVGTLPYNLYYPPGTAPGIPVLPPLPTATVL